MKRQLQNYTETVVNNGRAKRSTSRLQVQGFLNLHQISLNEMLQNLAAYKFAMLK